MTVEAELLSAAADVFLKLGFKDFQIVVNHRKLLNAVLAAAPACRRISTAWRW